MCPFIKDFKVVSASKAFYLDVFHPHSIWGRVWAPERLPHPSPHFPKAFGNSSFLSCSCCSVAQLWPTLCDPMDHGTPDLPVHHQLPELAQTHVHRVGDVTQPSHPLSSPSPPAFSLSQHQGLFNESALGLSLGASASVLPVNIQGGFPLGWTGLMSLSSKGL